MCFMLRITDSFMFEVGSKHDLIHQAKVNYTVEHRTNKGDECIDDCINKVMILIDKVIFSPDQFQSKLCVII